MQFGSPYQRWPVPRDWRGDPCRSAPASERCRDYTADLVLQSYGLDGGLGQPPGGPDLKTTLGVMAMIGLVWWLMKEPAKKKKRPGRLPKAARKGVRRKKGRVLAGYAPA